MAQLFKWELETYDARYTVSRSGEGGPQAYPFIMIQSKSLAHGISATVYLSFYSQPTSMGQVSLPSYEGGDWSYEYYVFLDSTQFDTIREFLDSEKPIWFESWHEDTPWGELVDITYWILRTDGGEPVGEEEDKMSIVSQFRAPPDELLPDEAQEISETLTRDLELDESQSQSSEE